MYVFVEEEHIVICLLGFCFVLFLPILDGEIYVEAEKQVKNMRTLLNHSSFQLMTNDK